MTKERPLDVEWCSTGIPKLDEFLGGKGLPRGIGVTVFGPSHVGKTVLSAQIQFAAMSRGEACLFISYDQPWRNVVRMFLTFGWNIYEFMDKGNFKILDNASMIFGIAPEDEKEMMTEIERKGIVFADPRDQEKYFQIQHDILVQMLENSTRAGVNVIDSADYRIRYLQAEIKMANERITAYFQKFRVRLANQLGLIGVHVYTPDPGDPTPGQMLKTIEESTIELAFRERPETREIERYIRVLGVPYTQHDRRWHHFSIVPELGITILE
jgi:KaiC/GvpD/RAD55 family RecA-like ATPase